MLNSRPIGKTPGIAGLPPLGALLLCFALGSVEPVLVDITPERYPSYPGGSLVS
jgi:hypothetical protein